VTSWSGHQEAASLCVSGSILSRESPERVAHARKIWRARGAPRPPTVTDRFIDLVSKRVRNYEFSPVWGFIADLASVHSHHPKSL